MTPESIEKLAEKQAKNLTSLGHIAKHQTISVRSALEFVLTTELASASPASDEVAKLKKELREKTTAYEELRTGASHIFYMAFPEARIK